MEPMTQRSLTMHAYEEPGRYVLALGGELDLGSVPAFEAAAARLADMGRDELLVDISEVGFIDSTGVRAILTVKAECEQRACGFSVTHGSAATERVFELTRLLERLPFRQRPPERFRREVSLWPQDGEETESRSG
jgi:anti-anti-sigma factor